MRGTTYHYFVFQDSPLPVSYVPMNEELCRYVVFYEYEVHGIYLSSARALVAVSETSF